MTHPTTTSDSKPFPGLDATCDRIVAALTRRLAQAAENLERYCPHPQHDFLLPVLDPDLTPSTTGWRQDAEISA